MGVCFRARVPVYGPYHQEPVPKIVMPVDEERERGACLASLADTPSLRAHQSCQTRLRVGTRRSPEPAPGLWQCQSPQAPLRRCARPLGRWPAGSGTERREGEGEGVRFGTQDAHAQGRGGLALCWRAMRSPRSNCTVQCTLSSVNSTLYCSVLLRLVSLMSPLTDE